MSEEERVNTTGQDRRRAVEVLAAIEADELWRTDTWQHPVERIAAALAEERERAVECFVILADEMERQVEFRREGNPDDRVASVREVDLRWLRLAISNARDPR